jgi:hypothetical protein
MHAAYSTGYSFDTVEHVQHKVINPAPTQTLLNARNEQSIWVVGRIEDYKLDPHTSDMRTHLLVTDDGQHSGLEVVATMNSCQGEEVAL